MRCPKCGVEYPENSDRCQFCGHPKNASPEITDKEGKKRDLNELNKGQEIKKSHFSAKLLGLIGIIFFFPLAVASGIYLIAQKEKDAKYWGYAFLLVGGILWIAGVILVYTMGYDKLMATYNLTNYSYNLTDYSFKL